MAVAFVLVKLRPGQEASAQAALREASCVAELHPVLGEHDLICKLKAPDYESLATTMPAIRTARGVASTKTLTAKTSEPA